MYEYNMRTGFSQCDANKTLSITSLIDMFQDCSTFQSEDLGVGLDSLEPMNLVWVLNYWEIDIIDLPKLCDQIVVGTFPYDFKGCFGYRNFYLKDKDGNYIVKANSLWTLIDTENFKPKKAPEIIENAYILENKLDMTYNGRKVILPEDATVTTREPITIQYHHLDSNHHVNNGQYIKLAMSEIDEEFSIVRLRVDYRKQAMLGDIIYPVVYKKDNKYVVALNNTEGVPYSVMEVTTN